MGGGGGGQAEGTTTTTPWQQDDFSKLLREAELGYRGGFFDEEYMGGEASRAGISDQQRSLYEQMAGPQGTSQMGLDALNKTLGAYDPNNPALSGAIDMAAGDINRNLQENLLPSLGSDAGQAGQFGSTRHGIAEGIALRGANEQLGDVATQMRLADMQTHQANQQAAMSNLGNITSGLEYSSSGRQREEQASIDDLFARWEYESGVDLQNLSAYKGLISGDMGGTSEFEPSGGK